MTSKPNMFVTRLQEAYVLSFCSNPYSGSGTIEFARFLLPSPADLDL